MGEKGVGFPRVGAHSKMNKGPRWFGDKYTGPLGECRVIVPALSELSDRRRNTNVEGVRGGANDGVLVSLLLLVRAITSAFTEAREIDSETGNPSEHARAAYRWLMAEPPTHYRTLPGTFAAFCNALGPEYERNKVRESGTPVGSYCWKDTIGGIAAIRQVWNKAKFEWYISGGPQRLAAREALTEQLKQQRRDRETGQMHLSMEINLPEYVVQ